MCSVVRGPLAGMWVSGLESAPGPGREMTAEIFLDKECQCAEDATINIILATQARTH